MSVSNHFKAANARNFMKEIVASGTESKIETDEGGVWIGYGGIHRFTVRRYRSSVVATIGEREALGLIANYLYPDPNSYAFMDTDPAYGHKKG